MMNHLGDLPRCQVVPAPMTRGSSPVRRAVQAASRGRRVSMLAFWLPIGTRRAGGWVKMSGGLDAQVGPDVDEFARGEHAPASLTVELLQRHDDGRGRVNGWYVDRRCCIANMQARRSARILAPAWPAA
jgi:hypothetical protein